MPILIDFKPRRRLCVLDIAVTAYLLALLAVAIAMLVER